LSSLAVAAEDLWVPVAAPEVLEPVQLPYQQEQHTQLLWVAVVVAHQDLDQKVPQEIHLYFLQ
jgi:hypothetical protein